MAAAILNTALFYKLSNSCGAGENYITVYPNPLAGSTETVNIRVRANYQGNARIMVTNKPWTATDNPSSFNCQRREFIFSQHCNTCKGYLLYQITRYKWQQYGGDTKIN